MNLLALSAILLKQNLAKSTDWSNVITTHQKAMMAHYTQTVTLKLPDTSDPESKITWDYGGQTKIPSYTNEAKINLIPRSYLSKTNFYLENSTEKKLLKKVTFNRPEGDIFNRLVKLKATDTKHPALARGVWWFSTGIPYINSNFEAPEKASNHPFLLAVNPNGEPILAKFPPVNTGSEIYTSLQLNILGTLSRLNPHTLNVSFGKLNSKTLSDPFQSLYIPTGANESIVDFKIISKKSWAVLIKKNIFTRNINRLWEASTPSITWIIKEYSFTGKLINNHTLSNRTLHDYSPLGLISNKTIGVYTSKKMTNFREANKRSDRRAILAATSWKVSDQYFYGIIEKNNLTSSFHIITDEKQTRDYPLPIKISNQDALCITTSMDSSDSTERGLVFLYIKKSNSKIYHRKKVESDLLYSFDLESKKWQHLFTITPSFYSNGKCAHFSPG